MYSPVDTNNPNFPLNPRIYEELPGIKKGRPVFLESISAGQPV